MSLLEVKNLKTSFFTKAGEIRAVDDVSFSLDKGRVLGIVGESGSGKSVTAYSILRILSDNAKILSGTVELDGRNLVSIPEKDMAGVRGNRISMVFQDPMSSLNPVFTVGYQLREAVMLHSGRSRAQAAERSAEMLSLVGINDPKRRMSQYPHQLSGGMRQRVMIAMALVCEPDVLIADEPTTALDVTIQAQILELMKELQAKLGMAIILITHDLGVIAGMCDEVDVMYAGRIVERGVVDEIFYNPRHEYTKGLLKSIPASGQRLVPIPGSPVDLLSLPPGCAFASRCPSAMKICLAEKPEETPVGESHLASCWLNAAAELEASGVRLKAKEVAGNELPGSDE